VLYHANCYDGFGSAWTAWRKFGDAAVYQPVTHGNPPPALPEGSDVLIADFSYPRALLEELASRHHVQVLDHHKTAEADLRGLPYCEFDMDRSGAMMTWNHLFPDSPPPALVQYVQDRDLWRFTLPQSRAVSAWIASWPFAFDVWSRLAAKLEEHPEEVYGEGAALLRLKAQNVDDMCQHVRMVEIAGHTVPVVNATVCLSEVCERLLQRYPDATFSGYYLDREDGKRQWGLRSRGDFDVSAVAKQFGGGGHAAASGFTEDLANLRIGITTSRAAQP
jgi:oligoribonuclease NrnB/cAMP/cGMP phosphodiesterase (DHH superfamily)